MGVVISALIAYIIILLGGNRAFVGPLTGAVIATGITLSFNSYLRSEEKEASRRTLVNTLIAELTIFHYSINLRIKAFKESNNPLGYVYIIEDYFTIFTQNANKLGLLPEDVATEVIKVYFSIKGLFDTIRGNSEENKQIQTMTNYLRKMQATLSEDELLASSEFRGISAQYEIDTEKAEQHFNILINNHSPIILKDIELLIDKLSALK